MLPEAGNTKWGHVYLLLGGERGGAQKGRAERNEGNENTDEYPLLILPQTTLEPGTC